MKTKKKPPNQTDSVISQKSHRSRSQEIRPRPYPITQESHRQVQESLSKIPPEKRKTTRRAGFFPRVSHGRISGAFFYYYLFWLFRFDSCATAMKRRVYVNRCFDFIHIPAKSDPAKVDNWLVTAEAYWRKIDFERRFF